MYVVVEGGDDVESICAAVATKFTPSAHFRRFASVEWIPRDPWRDVPTPFTSLRARRLMEYAALYEFDERLKGCAGLGDPSRLVIVSRAYAPGEGRLHWPADAPKPDVVFYVESVQVGKDPACDAFCAFMKRNGARSVKRVRGPDADVRAHHIIAGVLQASTDLLE